MESKKREVFESFVYIFLIILVIFASVYGSINIRLIPLLFILGIVGNALFKRQIMTTVLGFIVALCINYLKTPTDIAYVFFTSSLMCLNIIMGEVFGKYILKILELIKQKEEKNKKIVPICILTFTFVLSILIHNFTNGSIITYQECKKSLNEYLKENYSNFEKFKEINANYYLYKNPRYVFYLANTDIGEVYKFTVYVNEENMIIDGYKEAVQSNKTREINTALTNCILKLEDSSKYDDLSIKAKFANDDKVCVEISKVVNDIDEKSLEKFAKEIVSYLDDIKDSSVYEKIEQIDLSLKCSDKEKTGVASIIYLDEYNLAIEEKSNIPYKYILKALSMEYDY